MDSDDSDGGERLNYQRQADGNQYQKLDEYASNFDRSGPLVSRTVRNLFYFQDNIMWCESKTAAVNTLKIAVKKNEVIYSFVVTVRC